MFGLNGKAMILAIYPITTELQILTLRTSLALQWLHYDETRWEITTQNLESLTDTLHNLKATSEKYQREPFCAGSSTHRWIWYYDSYISPQVKLLDGKNAERFRYRETVILNPRDYGNETMETYVKQQMLKRRHEFVDSVPLRLWTGTYNTAGTGPEMMLSQWYYSQSQRNEALSEPPHIIVVCLQEMCPLNTVNILGSEQRKAEWLQFIYSGINAAFPDRKFTMVKEKDLVGLLMVVYIDSKFMPFVYNVSHSSVKLGLNGIAGNKGAILIRFELFDSSFCFINCHLAPHTKNVRIRNRQIGIILKEANFKLSKHHGIYEHDFVVWAGDYNYRLAIPLQNICNLCELGIYSELVKSDQFIQEREKHTLLPGFTEGQIDFPPTFKYRIGIENNTFNLKREPAWCDRIMYKGGMELEKYGSCLQIFQSDHKPVYALFNLQVSKADPERMKKVRLEILRKIDEEYYIDIPQVSLDATYVHFDQVRYKEHYISKIRMTNIGGKILQFSIKQFEDKFWGQIHPFEGTLEVNESITLEVTVMLTECEVKQANLETDFMKTIHIISLLGGSDHFIEIDCEYKGSSFGASLDVLASIDRPIVKLPCHMSQYNSLKSQSCPHQLVRMLNFIREHFHVKGLFQETGCTQMMQTIRHALDSGDDFPEDTDPFSMCATLIEFLEMLAVPVIPGDFQDTQEMYERMPLVNQSTLTCIVVFICEFAQASGIGKDEMSGFFTEALMHINQETCKDYQNKEKFIADLIIG